MRFKKEANSPQPWHTHTRTLCLYNSLSHTRTHTYMWTRSFYPYLPHTTHTHTRTLCLYNSLSHTRTHTYMWTRSFYPYLPHTTHTHTRTLCLYNSLSHTRTHTYIWTRSFYPYLPHTTHTHTNTHLCTRTKAVNIEFQVFENEKFSIIRNCTISENGWRQSRIWFLNGMNLGRCHMFTKYVRPQYEWQHQCHFITWMI